METHVPPPPTFDRPPQRVVSLVPSMTESLFELGAGSTVVGITDYCTYPADQLKDLPRIGGTKNPDVGRILSLRPDLVLANWEENTRSTVEALEDAGVPVWVTCPHSVRDSLDVLWALSGLFKAPAATLRLKTLESAVDWARAAAADREPVPYFCPVWFDRTSTGQEWWMTFNADTYAHDLLTLCGGENIFAGRSRLYPLAAEIGDASPENAGARDTRYPRLGLDEIRAARPRLILLPDEPYAFDAGDKLHLAELLTGTPAVDEKRIYLIDGSLLTWHGTRLGKALAELPAYFG